MIRCAVACLPWNFSVPLYVYLCPYVLFLISVWVTLPHVFFSFLTLIFITTRCCERRSSPPQEPVGRGRPTLNLETSIEIWNFRGQARSNEVLYGFNFSNLIIRNQRGCCIRSPLVTKRFEVVLLHEDITQRELKKSSPWNTIIHVF